VKKYRLVWYAKSLLHQLRHLAKNGVDIAPSNLWPLRPHLPGNSADSTPSNKSVVIFETVVTPGRKSTRLQEHLKNYKGFLPANGYGKERYWR